MAENAAKDKASWTSLARGLVGKSASANTTSALNPIQNMCVRFYHQAVIKNETLYIYGGVESFVPDNSAPRVVIGTNSFLIAVGMNSSWDWKTNISESLLAPALSPPPGNNQPPIFVRGALFSGSEKDNNIYIYGGTASPFNTSFSSEPPFSPQYTLWSYDTVVNQWGQHDLSLTAKERPSAGAYAEASDQGLAFYLNGEITNGTSTLTAGIGDNLIFLEGLVVINTTSQTSRNLSTTSLTGTRPRTGGVLVYLSGVGVSGILVSIGGSYHMSPSASSKDEIGNLIPMNSIDILDIDSIYNGGQGTWYNQNATGTAIPYPRVDFCAVSVAASDNSSYNIYVYGGRASPTQAFDDIYVLSIPSFTWTQVYEATPSIPRYGHTCHLVGRRQMLTVGGSGSSKLTFCDWETKGVAIWDMSMSQWGSAFNYDASPYAVPGPVLNTIGGNSSGFATITTPSGNFSSTALAALFNTNRVQRNGTQTNSTVVGTLSPSTSLNNKEIAGVVLVAVFGPLILTLIICFFRGCFQQGKYSWGTQKRSSSGSGVRQNGENLSLAPMLKDRPYDPIHPNGL